MTYRSVNEWPTIVIWRVQYRGMVEVCETSIVFDRRKTTEIVEGYMIIIDEVD